MTKHRDPARVAADFLLNLIACNLGPKLKTTPGSESLTQWGASARGPSGRPGMSARCRSFLGQADSICST